MPPIKAIWATAAATTIGLKAFVPEYLPLHSSILSFVLLSVLGFASWITYRVVIYPHLFSPFKDLPSPPGGSFFHGQRKKIMSEPSGVPMKEWVATVPNNGLIYYRAIFNTERLLVTSPKVLGEVLVTKNYEFVKPWHIRAGLGRILGVGLLLAEGDEHKRQRKDFMPAFSYRHVRDLYPVFWAKSKEMVETIGSAINKPSAETEKPDNVVEVGDWTSRATLDIIGVAGMGRDFDSLHDPENRLAMTYKTIFTPPKHVRYLQIASLFLPAWLLHNLPIKRNQEIEEAQTLIKQTCRDIIREKKGKMEKAERTEVDIVSVALESGSFSEEELVNQMMTFLVAGHETTATAMVWAVYIMCKHTDIQAKLRAEVTSKLPSLRNRDAQVTAADIDDCHYLHAFCNEVFRVWAPVALTMRVAAQDTTVNGHYVPKDTLIIMSPWAINTSKELWGEDAHDFKPERWLAEGQANKGGADSNYSFLTFLHGPRSCIGQSFSKAEFACLVAAWAGRFETEFRDADFVPEIKGGVTQKPKGGLWVRLRENTSW